jgi:hypothetical protein
MAIGAAITARLVTRALGLSVGGVPQPNQLGSMHAQSGHLDQLLIAQADEIAEWRPLITLCSSGVASTQLWPSLCTYIVRRNALWRRIGVADAAGMLPEHGAAELG